MPLVAELCDPVIVLARGTQIAEGAAAEIQRDPVVLDAYLGEGWTVESRAGGACLTPLLTLEGVVGGYGGGDVLQGVDLDVQRGSITCIVGPNGAGKSTVLRAVSGLLRARKRPDRPRRPRHHAAPRRPRSCAAGSCRCRSRTASSRR